MADHDDSTRREPGAPDCKQAVHGGRSWRVSPVPPRRLIDLPHGCLHAAVVVDGDRRVWFPCRSHEGGRHHYAAHWPACPAPWCRLPCSHHLEGTMHDIPGGTVEYHDAIGVTSRG